MCIHISPEKADGGWKEDKEMQMAKCSHCCSLLELLMPETQTGLAPAQTLTWAQVQPHKVFQQSKPWVYLFPTQFPLPQPAITPQSLSTSSLHTQLPPEGRSSSLTCMLTLQKRDINFHFSPKDTTFSLNYWMLQWLHLKSWAFSSILLPRVMQSLSFQITQCICNQAVSWL